MGRVKLEKTGDVFVLTMDAEENRWNTGLDQVPKVMVLDRLDGASGLPPIPMHETGFSKRP